MAAAQCDLICKFGKVSYGDKTISIGWNVEREQMTIDLAVEMFIDRRLTGKLILGRLAEQGSRQQTMETDLEFDGVFDIKKFGVSAKAFAGTLSFMLGEMDDLPLKKLANRFGRMLILQSSDIPHDAAAASDAEDDAEGDSESEDANNE